MSSVGESLVQRRRMLIQGIVQGVGFRPFVYGQARDLGLSGFVFNDSRGVTIEIEGHAASLERFTRALREQTPPLARIDAVFTEQIAPLHEATFEIISSQHQAERSALISPDTCVCADCLRELDNRVDRR